MQQEEARQPELVDQRQLLLEPCPSLRMAVWIALAESAFADAAELHARRLVAVGEIWIAIAELLRQVELEPLGQLARARYGVAVVGEAVEHVLRRGEDGFVVAAALALAAVERGAAADRDEHVLQRSAARVVRVHVSRGDGAYAERLGEIAQRCVAARVSALVRPLELDVEMVAAEDTGKPRGRIRIMDGEPVPSTTGETDEPLVQLVEQRRIECGRQRLRALLGTRLRMGCGQQPAEVRVARSRLHEKRDVRSPLERHFGAGDRPDAEMLRRVCKLERPVDAVVIGERERLVAELGCAGGELLRLRGAVEERVRRVRVQFDVRHYPARWMSRTSPVPAWASVSAPAGIEFSASCRISRRSSSRTTRTSRASIRTPIQTTPTRSTCSKARSSSSSTASGTAPAQARSSRCRRTSSMASGPPAAPSAC